MVKSIFLVLSLLQITWVQSQDATSSDYLVYSTLIKENIAQENRTVTVLLKTSREDYQAFLGDTADYIRVIEWWMRAFRTPFDSTSFGLIQAFERRRFKQEKISNSFSVPLQVRLLKKSKFLKYFKESPKEGWNKFYELNPKSAGVFAFSDVFYSSEGDRAIVYYRVLRNGLNGLGEIAVLAKISGQWKIVERGTLWQY